MQHLLLSITLAFVLLPGSRLADFGAGQYQVKTNQGWLAGLDDGRTLAFKGVPYAKPPVGELRWKAPEVPSSWQGLRSARQYASICPQQSQRFLTDHVFGSEDCLYLNIWVPKVALEFQQRLPVMFFIHGGGYELGSSTGISQLELFNGAALSRDEVVVVTINYRLGALGFLGHPAFSAESEHHSSGNYGFMDQLAALRWVNENISAFAGDPERVTIFGESAGANSVLHLLASPQANGLFHAAIMQSPAQDTYTLANVESAGRRLAHQLGCPLGESLAYQAKCLRSVSPEKLILAQPKLIENFAPSADRPFERRSPGAMMKYAPVIDHHLVMDAPIHVIEAGRHNKVPVIIGSNYTELPSWIFLSKIRSEEDMRSFLERIYSSPNMIKRLSANYMESAKASPAKALGGLLTDSLFTCPTKRMAGALAAGGTPVFNYIFDQSADPQQDSQAHFSMTYHGSELMHVFQNHPKFLKRVAPKLYGLQENISSRWTAFAKTGRPSVKRGTNWTPYSKNYDNTLQLARDSHMRHHVRSSACATLKDILGPEDALEFQYIMAGNTP